jgi:hypothetical protein
MSGISVPARENRAWAENTEVYLYAASGNEEPVHMLFILIRLPSWNAYS